jgi:ribosomal protein S18 acetylase RimI-like enzyme
MRWQLRPASLSDRGFLYALHCVTMREVIEKTWGWDEEWQRADFARRMGSYVVWVIESEAADAGALCVEWLPSSLYIHELQILPEFQNRGIGTEVLGHAIAQASGRGLPVTLSVVAANPRAKHLYERLGFQVTAVEPPFIRMQRDPGPSAFNS